jgi:hypothetical protein
MKKYASISFCNVKITPKQYFKATSYFTVESGLVQQFWSWQALLNSAGRLAGGWMI